MIIDRPDSHFIFVFHPSALMGKNILYMKAKSSPMVRFFNTGESGLSWGKNPGLMN